MAVEVSFSVKVVIHNDLHMGTLDSVDEEVQRLMSKYLISDVRSTLGLVTNDDRPTHMQPIDVEFGDLRVSQTV